MANFSFSKITNIAKKWLDYLSPVLLLLAIVWLCWSLSRILWLFLAPVLAPNLPEVARQNQAVYASNPNNFMIFAEPQENVLIGEQEQAVAPSNIELKGVMVANPMNNSSALLAVNGRVLNYRVNKKIEGTDYILSSVDWNKVILKDSSNKQLTLKISEPFELNQKFKVNPKNNDKQAMVNDIDAPQAQAFDSSTEMPMGNQANNDLQEENDYNEDGNNGEPMEHTPPPSIDQNHSVSPANPAGYLGQMGMSATQDGYEVTEAMSDELRNKAGLQLGDKIVSINGEPVGSSPIADAEAFAKAKKNGQAKIQIKRGEQLITINQSF